MILNDRLKGSGEPVIVLGDPNDGVGTNTLNILTEQSSFYLDGYFSEGSDKGLYSVATLQASGPNATPITPMSTKIAWRPWTTSW